MTAAIIFDDGQGVLAPLTDLRAAFDVRTGALTTLQRLQRALDLSPVALLVPDHLVALTAERHSLAVNTVPDGLDGDVLLINGRCPLDDELISTLTPGQRVIESSSGDVIAACVTPSQGADFVKTRRLPPGKDINPALPALISRPWHVQRFRDRALSMDLELLNDSQSQPLPPGVLAIGEAPLTIDPTAVVYPGVTLDLEHGPIVIADHATIRPGATLSGPCYVGPHSTVLDRALIKANTAIGPWCKVSGEIGATIFQGYANKAHDGHLGDSYVGEWVNLGAGTTNSNLLNTYGEIIARATPDSPNELTGEVFLGCTLGDHVKTAICTRLMTGAVIHTGAMIASTAAASGCIPAFTWATDTGTRFYRFEKFVGAAKAMMARRKITPSTAYLEALKRLHEAGPKP